MINPVIIIGANPTGRVVLEVFTTNSVVVYGFLDDNKNIHDHQIDEINVLGAVEEKDFLSLLGKKCDVFVATDEIKLHKSIINILHDHKVQPVNAIHATATVSNKAILGHGNLLDAGTIVAPGTEIGSHNNIMGQAYIGAEVTIGDYVQLGVGCKVNIGVTIANDAFIGAGATIVAGVTIGKGARIGAGSVVVTSVAAGKTVFGNPASVVKN